jgi:hypothetical protein
MRRIPFAARFVQEPVQQPRPACPVPGYKESIAEFSPCLRGCGVIANPEELLRNTFSAVLVRRLNFAFRRGNQGSAHPDGYRLRLERNGDRVRLITKGGDWSKRYPWIVEAALKNRQKQFVIDGEAIIMGVDGYSGLQRRSAARGLRFAGHGRRRFAKSAAVNAQGESCSLTRTSTRRHLPERIRARERSARTSFARYASLALRVWFSKHRDRPYRGGGRQKH